ncbi:MAG: NBR1-Ig-like domain-containing protein [Anaerolineae bacterium]|nr:NBR1-Ig-like domain-containing protein [Anaerolineae bacterium]MDK1119224.1 NBR1-Ig-like domain-containing protein [Anaerolineae bacterium]
MIKKVFSLIALATFLYACGPTTSIEPTIDVNEIYTAAAKTVIAELTQTGQVDTPTATALVTESASTAPEASLKPTETVILPTDIPSGSTPTEIICDDARWAADVTVPDNTEMIPGQDFVKTWMIRNTGSCTWGTSYSVIYAYGEKMGGIAEPLITAVTPGEEIEISVRFKAPTAVGLYSSTWRMTSAANSPFGENFYALIVVR